MNILKRKGKVIFMKLLNMAAHIPKKLIFSSALPLCSPGESNQGLQTKIPFNVIRIYSCPTLQMCIVVPYQKLCKIHY